MRLTSKIKLLPAPEAFAALQQTLALANDCANWLSDRAWDSRTFAQFALHRLAYVEARAVFRLSAQMVVSAISKVADAYKADTLRKRVFRSTGAFAYDDRILSWNLERRTVSIWTTQGRLTIAFAGGSRQLARLASRRGETDLIFQRGAFYLAATCEVEASLPAEPVDLLGVDLGIINIASDSDGKHYSGSAVRSVRYRHRRLRAKLQRKHTTAANRRLKQLSGKEQRFARHVNHVVSKQIVAAAKGTGRGIAIEQLDGIRERITVGRRQRAVLHSWAFYQLRLFLEYKAKLAGVPVVLVDPGNSSRECSVCHHVSKSNRPSPSSFRCRACGHLAHADSNAAANLRERGRAACKPAIRGSRLSADRPAKLPAFSR